MNSFYVVMGCPICREMEKALLIVNLRLPVDEKINWIDIHSRDPRIRLLDNLSPGEEYHLPTIVFGNNKSNVVLLSSSSATYNINFIRLLNNDILNLY